MIKSMTGFGKSVVQMPAQKITIEIKSLNSKNLDIQSRIPTAYKAKELTIRNLISNKLQRGKVEFSLLIEATGKESNTVVNKTLVVDYMKQLKAIVDGEDLKILEMALRMPDVLKTEQEEMDAEEFSKIKDAISLALSQVEDFRISEGIVLEKELVQYIKNITVLLEEVKRIDPQRGIAVREKLEKAIKQLEVEKDENRFEQELIYYIEKYDITEEKVRLARHLDYFIETIQMEKSNGKKLGFIAQEIGREINTLGSKANFAPIQKIIVEMKDELEKIKEQLLNVL